MTTALTIVGLPSFLRRLVAAQAAANLLAAKGLYKRGLSIFEKSQRLVPVEFGTLRSSGHVTPPERVGGGLEVRVGYGGAAAGYALYVHEITTSFHAPPTQAKFLEQPALEEAAAFAGQMAAEFSVIWGVA